MTYIDKSIGIEHLQIKKENELRLEIKYLRREILLLIMNSFLWRGRFRCIISWSKNIEVTDKGNGKTRN